MYKFLKNLLIILSMSLLTVFSVWNIFTYSAPIPGGVVESVYVMNGKLDLPSEIQKIAIDNHVLIAKQIVIPSDTPQNGFVGKYTFEKFGAGNLPSIYPDEKDAQIIANSNNNTNYIIIGSKLTASSLANQLREQGNIVIPARTDSRLASFNSLISAYKLPILIILTSFAGLLLAEYIDKLKGDGIRRLAGISRIRLAFSSVLRDGKTILIIFLLSILLGSLYMIIIGKFWLAYFESLSITLLAGALTFFILSFILSTIIFYILQIQTINLSIKGKSPIFAIAVVIVIFQTVAILSSMNSILDLNNANKQVSLLQTAQNTWSKNKQYFAPTIMGAAMRANPDSLKSLLLNILQQPDVLLSYSNELVNSSSESDWNVYMKQYVLPTNGEGWANVLYANPALLKKEGIKLPDDVQNKINHLTAGGYAILVPDSQKTNFTTLISTWKNIQNEVSNYLTKSPIVSLYASQSVFGYSVMKNQFNNYSSVPDPLIIVYDSATFENGNSKEVATNALAYLSNGRLLITNREVINNLFAKYNLQLYEGSFYNGYYAIADHLNDEENQRNLLFTVNFFCLLSSLLLISLLNSIYLYQNRREFFVQRLAGKSWLDIHTVYLATVTALTAAISALASLWLHVPKEAYTVPVIYLALVIGLFTLQIHRGKSANILYLKGM